jgi:hypothetical protein
MVCNKKYSVQFLIHVKNEEKNKKIKNKLLHAVNI